MDLFEEQQADMLWPLAILAALSVFLMVRRLKVGWQTWTLLGLQGLVFFHYLKAHYSDHTVFGVMLRLLVAILTTIVAIWALRPAIRAAIRAIKKDRTKPKDPLAGTKLYALAWSLRAMVYLFVLFQAWFVLALAVRRFLSGYNQTGNGLDIAAAWVYAMAEAARLALMWIGGLCLIPLLVLALLLWRRKRKAAKAAAKAAKAALAKKAAAKKAAPPATGTPASGGPTAVKRAKRVHRRPPPPTS